MCHLSPKSYPYILGTEYFNEYHSVACSGAVTDDIIDESYGYQGQVLDKITQGTRNQADILRLFSPGYIFQNKFTQTYRPEALVLSIGGNNVGFSDILKSCIADISANSTCYATRDERVEVLNSINDAFYTLVDTYKDIQNASPTTRIYVVGYPQIVKPDGTCGDNVRLKASETEFASQLTSRLDSVIARAAAKAGVFYVDTEHAFDGFRLCEAKPGAAAMNGITLGTDDGPKILGAKFKLLANETYHPTVLGHQLLASTIAEQTKSLTAPMPDPQPLLGGPVLDVDDPFLTEVPETGQNVFERVADGSMVPANYIIKGVATKLSLNGLVDNLASNSTFDIVLHSTPVDLGQATSDANGDIATTITLPDDVPPGMHTLHLYGKDFAGQPIDVQKVIYVLSPDGPAYDGYCQVVPDSGKDVDEDGIDDACDPVIDEATVKPVPVTKPGDNSDLTPTGSSTGNTTLSSSQPAEMTPAIQPAPIATVASYRLTVPIAEGVSAATPLSEKTANVASAQIEATKPQVLGTSTRAPGEAARPKAAEHSWLFWEAVAAIFGLSGLALVIRANR